MTYKTFATDRTKTPLGDEHAKRARMLELLDRIEAIFFAQGYRAVTMDDLAAELRCSKRALYEIAPNRRALFLEVVDRWSRRIRSLGLLAASQAGNPKARLAAFLAPGVSQTVGMTESFLRDLLAFPDARKLLDEHQRDRMNTVRDIVEDGIRSGHFASMHPHLVAGICLAGIARINDPDFLRESCMTFSEAFAELYRLLMTGLERDPSDINLG